MLVNNCIYLFSMSADQALETFGKGYPEVNDICLCPIWFYQCCRRCSISNINFSTWKRIHENLQEETVCKAIFVVCCIYWGVYFTKTTWIWIDIQAGFSKCIYKAIVESESFCKINEKKKKGFYRFRCCESLDPKITIPREIWLCIPTQSRDSGI